MNRTHAPGATDGRGVHAVGAEGACMQRADPRDARGRPDTDPAADRA